MADNISFPWWFVLLGLGVESARVTVPLAVVAVLLYFCLGRRNVFRIALFATGIPAILSLAGVTYFYGGHVLEKSQSDAYNRQHTRTLSAPLQVGTAHIPSGVSLTDERYEPGWIEVHAFTKPIAIAPGALAKGEIEIRSKGAEGYATLVRDAVINDVPCAAGAVTFASGQLEKCALSGRYRVANMAFQRGTNYELLGQSMRDFTVGDHPPSIRIAGHRLPEGTEVTILDRRTIQIELPSRNAIGADSCVPTMMRYDIPTRVTVPINGDSCAHVAPHIVTLSSNRDNRFH